MQQTYVKVPRSTEAGVTVPESGANYSAVRWLDGVRVEDFHWPVGGNAISRHGHHAPSRDLDADLGYHRVEGQFDDPFDLAQAVQIINSYVVVGNPVRHNDPDATRRASVDFGLVPKVPKVIGVGLELSAFPRVETLGIFGILRRKSDGLFHRTLTMGAAHEAQKKKRNDS